MTKKLGKFKCHYNLFEVVVMFRKIYADNSEFIKMKYRFTIF